MSAEEKPYKVLKGQVRWKDLFFYQKADVIYQMAFAFCDRFIHLYKDRTRDQVIQAARSCKQNIVEGLSDGVTSTEMQLKLLNVARASLQELREDFEDYIKSRGLKFYGEPTDGAPTDCFDGNRQRYAAMLTYCRNHNRLEEYQPYFAQWTDEEMCNYGITLCHMTDKMMLSFMKKLEQEFITEGGIKERMYKARTGYRQDQEEQLKALKAENLCLQQELEQWQTRYEDLKQRALRAYNAQQEQIAQLQQEIKALKRNL